MTNKTIPDDETSGRAAGQPRPAPRRAPSTERRVCRERRRGPRRARKEAEAACKRDDSRNSFSHKYAAELRDRVDRPRVHDRDRAGGELVPASILSENSGPGASVC